MLLSDSRASFRGSLLAGPRHDKRCLRAPLQHRQRGLRVQADARDPPDTPKDGRKGGREWLQMLLSRFGPIRQAPANAHVLDFEKPLVELDNRIKEVSTQQAVLHAQGCTRPRTVLAQARGWRNAVLLNAWQHKAQSLGTVFWGTPCFMALRCTPCFDPDCPYLQVKTVAEVNNVDVSAAVKDLEVRAEQVSCCFL